MFKRIFIISMSVLLISLQSSFSQINLKAEDIQFRDVLTYEEQTLHHGDLKLLSDKSDYSGDDEFWGWLISNCILSLGTSYTSRIYGNFVVYGYKNFAHPHPTDSSKEILYTCVEAGEALTLARGVASTVNGKAIIDLPEHYSLVTSSEGLISVILTPEEQPATLYVVSKSKEQIEVAMKKDDLYEYGDIPFSFQVTGIRDGFEDQKPIQGILDKKTVSAKRKEYNKKCEAIAVEKMKAMKEEKDKIKEEKDKRK